MSPSVAYCAGRVFDGLETLRDHAVVVRDSRIEAVLPISEITEGTRAVACGAWLAPGFVDLQVNGGGGLLLGRRRTSSDDLARIAEAHARLGTTAIFPTLITASDEVRATTVDCVAQARAEGCPGIAGLHLEGPHLHRPGAHDPALIRPMTDDDLAFYLDAARGVGRLIITLAPEATTEGQIAALAEAGVVVSLGHSDCSFDTTQAARKAGASCVTHLFNAMSQVTARSPGLVGAGLSGGFSAGIIADGIHVHPETLRLALAGKEGPGELFLVSDAMAVAGTDLDEFDFDGRRILRRDGRLTLEDGTLAGADLDLGRAVALLVRLGLATPERALAMATAIPARVAGTADTHGRIAPGRAADFLCLDETLAVSGVWRAGVKL